MCSHNDKIEKYNVIQNQRLDVKVDKFITTIKTWTIVEIQFLSVPLLRGPETYNWTI